MAARYSTIDMPAEFKSPKLAGAMLTRGLMHLDREHTVGIESGSVYGAAILMPQLARSAGWTRELTSRVVSSYLMLFVCMIVHASLIKFISMEEKVFDAYGSRMFLCDFGASTEGCEGDECLGPGGTRITPARLYGWDAWVIRSWVRDSFKSLLPDMEDKINQIADPGEYGLESYACRLFCVCIFMISIMPETVLCLRMMRLFILVPTQNEQWLEVTEHTPNKEDADTSFANVKVKVAGMSCFWKVVNVIVVLLPKVILVYMTANAGVTFLMETEAMDDIIVNSVALGFLLNLEGMVTDALLSKTTSNLMEQCEPYDYQEQEEARKLDAKEIIDLFSERQRSNDLLGFCLLLKSIFVTRLAKLYLITAMTAFFVVKYYLEHCEYKGGQWVSKAVAAPKSLQFSFLNTLSAFPVPTARTPFWTMPEPLD